MLSIRSTKKACTGGGRHVDPKPSQTICNRVGNVLIQVEADGPWH